MGTQAFDLSLQKKVKDLTAQLSKYTNTKEKKEIDFQELDIEYNNRMKKDKEIEKKKKIEEKKNIEEYNFLNLSIQQIYTTFMNTLFDIIHDLIQLNYFKFPDVIKKILFIFLQKERIIYTGIGFIISSIFIFFILVSK